MCNNGIGLIEILKAKDTTVIYVDLRRNEYAVLEGGTDEYYNKPRIKDYKNNIEKIVDELFKRQHIKAYDNKKICRIMCPEFIRSCVNLRRMNYVECINVIFEDNSDGCINIRFDCNITKEWEELVIITIEPIFITCSEKKRGDFQYVWENINDYVFVHELDINTWKLTLIKYPEYCLSEIEPINVDYITVRDTYMVKFSNEKDYDTFIKRFSKESIINGLANNDGIYSTEIRFKRSNGRIEWYEANFVSEGVDNPKVIVTVKNIESIVRTKMKEEVQKAAYDDAYVGMLYYNLTRDTYSVMESDDSDEGFSGGSFENVIKYMASRMKEATAVRFLKIMNRERLMAMCEKNKVFSYEIENFDYYGKSRDFELSFRRIYNVSNEICCALMIRDIKQKKKEKREFLLNQNILNVALGKMYATVIQFDLTMDRYTVISKSMIEAAPIDIEGSMSELYRESLTKMHKDSIEVFSDMMENEGLASRIAAGEKEIEFKFRRLIEENRYIWFNIHLIVIDNPVNDNTIGLIFVRDINEEILKEEKLRYAVETANRANRAKTEFLVSVSHDIRTPMNAIMGYSELIEEKAYSNDIDFIKDNIGKVRSSSTHLLELINNILCMSAIESGKTVLQASNISIKEVAKKINNMMSIVAQNENVIYTFTYDELGDDVVYADNVRLEQILVNIIGNAIKYTPRLGKVEVSFNKTQSDRPDYNKYVFICKDTGVGMTQEFLTKVFEPFEREKSNEDDEREGTGLGMSITKKLIELMGGNIKVDSQKNVGTMMCVELYMMIALNKEEHIDSADKQSIKNMSILLAEDKKANYEVIKYMLEEFNVRLVHVKNGYEAVEAVKSSDMYSIDVILMDLKMPVMDGYEACKEIRKLDRDDAKNIPIVALTANAFIEDVLSTKEVGMQGHISKPVERKKLINELVKYNGRRNADNENITG